MPRLLAPSILAADFARLGEEAGAALRGGASWLHVDVMDGHLVANLTFGPGVVAALRAALPEAILDVHLMVAAPERWVDPFADAGAHRLSVHPEASANVHRAIDAIHRRGLAAGMALNPLTPLAHLDEALPLIDQVVVMSVDPGFGGQRYLPRSTARIAAVRERIAASGRDVRLQVDGGVTLANLDEVLAAGADVVVAGSAIFGASEGIEAAARAFVQRLGSST